MKGKLTTDELWHKDADLCINRRYNHLVKFIDEIKEPIYDLGEYSPMTKLLQQNFNVYTFDSVDFNKSFKIKAGTIFALEILEHLMNPLLFMESIKNSLLPNGIVYLSMPRVWPQFLMGDRHFYEIPDDKFKWLLDEVGLVIVKKDTVSIRGMLKYHWFGIRPIMRAFQVTRVYKIKRKEDF
jgi:hypothetical protein